MSTEAASTTTTKSADATRQISLVQLSLLAISVGIVGGVGAVVFRGLIALFHNFSFQGIFSVIYDANVFTAASPWGAAVILAPVIGSILVTLLVTKFAPEAKGHGVPEVMDAIYYEQGKIRPVVAVVKSLASAISIGTGGAVGREGPIIQIGASFGSTIGQIIRMAPWQRITLVAAGAGAGIAATFNTPIGGVMFAIELMMPEVSVRTFLPVALATGTATFIANLVLGPKPAFSVPVQALIGSHPASLSALLLFALLGIIIGLAATIFVRAIPFADDQFDRIKNPYLRHALGMAAVGVLFYVLFRVFGHYYVEGVGYATIQALLLGQMTSLLYILPLLYICKLVATSLTLGSGGSGGIFSPSLFMGATLGGAFGAVIDAIHPVAGASPGTLAIVGMAAMVGGGTGAVMTAVTMIFEMTRDYGIVMPMIVAVALSVGVRRMLSRENIYTIKLVDRGHYIPKALHANMFLVRHAADVMDSDVLVLPASADFDGFLRQPAHKGAFKHVVVTEGDRIVGVLRVNTAFRRGLEDTSTGVTLGDVAQKNFVVADADEIVFDVIERMWREGAAMAVVVRSHGKARASDVRGMISKEHVADSVAESIRPYGAA
jgi:chloride channel protein, CIC family